MQTSPQGEGFADAMLADQCPYIDLTRLTRKTKQQAKQLICILFQSENIIFSNVWCWVLSKVSRKTSIKSDTCDSCHLKAADLFSTLRTPSLL